MASPNDMKRLRILFIGNSHTYYNDLLELVCERAKREGFDCEVTMLAHGGWFLEQHAAEPDVSFNIRYVSQAYRKVTEGM